MENLNNEIENMTAPKTVEGRALRIPEGQKAFRMGFRAINMAGLRERFACDKVQATLDKEACDEVIKSRGHDPETSVILRSIFWRNINSMMVEYNRFKQSRGLFGKKRLVKIGREYHHADRPTKVCSVRLDPVDKYIADKIPDRCLESMQKATEVGLNWESFYVAYPVIETTPMKDPIILSLTSGSVSDPASAVFLEIDMWE